MPNFTPIARPTTQQYRDERYRYQQQPLVKSARGFRL